MTNKIQVLGEIGQRSWELSDASTGTSEEVLGDAMDDLSEALVDFGNLVAPGEDVPPAEIRAGLVRMAACAVNWILAGDRAAETDTLQSAVGS